MYIRYYYHDHYYESTSITPPKVTGYEPGEAPYDQSAYTAARLPDETSPQEKDS